MAQLPSHSSPKSGSSPSSNSSPRGNFASSNPKRPGKCTETQPFKLHTQRRGLSKVELMAKLQDLLAQEAKQRVPIAQKLPLTTDKSEVLPKGPVKEQTKPMKIKLHTQLRAVKRAEFNDWLMEEEEIKMLRKQLIPRAQLMPLFDRPFFPQRSTRPLTMPKDPSFHMMRNQCSHCVIRSGLNSLHQHVV
ncbi:protein TPX2 isoform X2 [Amborella trichopoda]|uniref:protein TPX2 isoform X2 n=1 Tax=Amborella trichopoda TaxID=13333 RepID=UPI0009BE95ED|nr:protein TPX2 isoform X2 [Amborella trichopoda]|eukprot:XP_020522494.1 protein TPX2 isoform X2 [Amborella trichopoda]